MYLCTVNQRNIYGRRRFQRWLEQRNRLQPYRRSRALLLALLSWAVQTGMLTLGALDPDSPGTLEQGAHIPYMASATLLLFVVLYLFNFRLLRQGLERGRLMAASLAGSLLLTGVYSLLTWWLEGATCGSQFNTLAVTTAVNETTAVIAWLITMLVHNVARHQQTMLENEHLQAENLRVHHESLERQVNPHFLFNSLNTLDGLMDLDREGAHRYLHKLADTYRYILQQHSEATLAEELRFTECYLEMMQIRYGEGLKVEMEVDEGLMGRLVPPISVQLLVENALKHNVATVRRPLTVRIETVETGRTAFVKVTNKIQRKLGAESGEAKGAGGGVGLMNLDGRCRLMCGHGINVEDDGVVFSVEMPLKRL